MDFFRRRRVKFAMRDASTGAHALYVAFGDDRAVAHGVFMLQGTGDDVGNNLHIMVRMHAKSGARRNFIVVDNAQRFEPHVIGVVIAAELKAMPAVQPA